jgi:rhodanese-related sulfurtransferase
LDTRSREEFEVSHIPGAIWVGFEVFDIESLENIPRDSKIVSYCSVGYRSEEITRKLREAGFRNVSNLYGGIFEWVNLGGEIENMQASKTDTLHVYKKMWGIWTSAKVKVTGR